MQVARFRGRVEGLEEVPVEALHLLCQWIVTTWSATSDVRSYDDFTAYWDHAESHCLRHGGEGAWKAKRAAARYAVMATPPQPAEIPVPVVPQPTTPEVHPHPAQPPPSPQPAQTDPQEASQQSGAAGRPAAMLAAALGVLTAIAALF